MRRAIIEEFVANSELKALMQRNDVAYANLTVIHGLADLRGITSILCEALWRAFSLNVGPSWCYWSGTEKAALQKSKAFIPKLADPQISPTNKYVLIQTTSYVCSWIL